MLGYNDLLEGFHIGNLLTHRALVTPGWVLHAAATGKDTGGKDLPALLNAEVDTFFSPSLDFTPVDRPAVNDIGRGAGAAKDGDMIVGHIDAGPGTPFHAFSWTEAGGVVDLGTLEPANNATQSSFATGVLSDGSVIVGYSSIEQGGNHAFRWTEAGGMVPLDPAASGTSLPSLAFGISSDGSTVVGSRNARATRWTQAGGFEEMGGAAAFSNASSANGSVVVGQLANFRAFRWTAAGGLVPMGTLPGDSFSMATAVSDDGSVIVGISSTDFVGRGGSGNGITFDPQDSRAFYWTEAGGMQDLSQLLADGGAELDGGKFAAALGISGDGNWFGGAFVLPTTPAGRSHPVFAGLSVEFDVAGDYNGDGDVDAADYTVWRNSFGMNGGDLAADGSGPEGVPDGTVDQFDYALWKANFGAGGGAGAASDAAVPEPGASGFAGAALIVGLYFGHGRAKSPAGSPRQIPSN